MIAVIYNEPKQSAPHEHWLFSHSGEKEIPDTFIDASENSVLGEMMMIRAALEKAGHEIEVFNADGNIHRLLNFLDEKKPEVIFNLCEGLDGEADQEMNVAGLYDLLHIPYTGASPLTLGLSLNKQRTKEILAAHHIPTARYILATSVETISHHTLRYPLIVKPAREDASIGIDGRSVVKTQKDLEERVAFVIKKFAEPAIVEEFIDGREFNVAVLGNNPPEVLPVSEIDFSTLPADMPRIVSYEAKWVEDSEFYRSTQPRCPAKIDDDRSRTSAAIAVRTYEAWNVAIMRV